MDREDLKKYKYNKEWVKERLDYIEEQKSLLTKITTTLSITPKCFGSGDKLAENIAKMLDNLNELSEKLLIMQEEQIKLLNTIEKVEEPYRTILDKHYIQNKTLVEVAYEMDYTYDHARRKNGIALNKFDMIVKKYKV